MEVVEPALQSAAVVAGQQLVQVPEVGLPQEDLPQRELPQEGLPEEELPQEGQLAHIDTRDSSTCPIRFPVPQLVLALSRTDRASQGEPREPNAEARWSLFGILLAAEEKTQ